MASSKQKRKKMNSPLYVFKMPDGKVELMSIKTAISMNNEHINNRIRQIFANLQNKRMKKDGFEPGFQANINENIHSRGEYDRRIKELGLIELGYDHIPTDTTSLGGVCRTLEFAKYAKEIGIDLSDNEMEAITTGEYFDPSKCDLSED